MLNELNKFYKKEADLIINKYCKKCRRVTKHIRKDKVDKCLTCEIED